MVEETGIGGPARDFPDTSWTLIRRAREDGRARRAALEALAARYWKPLYFRARRGGLPIEEAKDAVQGFLLHLLERDDFVERLDPAKGRLRSYLKTALDRWLVNLHEHRSAQKRGGGARTVGLDFDVAEAERLGAGASADAGAGPAARAAASPDDAFDREWALGVMERALARLRAEFEEGRRRGPFAVALRFFSFDAGEPPTYAEAAAEAAMSVPQLKAFLHRARTRFRDLVREEVGRTVEDEGEIDAEIADLMRVLAAPA